MMQVGSGSPFALIPLPRKGRAQNSNFHDRIAWSRGAGNEDRLCRLKQRSGDGFGYAYAFPGMNRVLQAVGRVIRCETDKGVVLLIDQRFKETRYRRLFPEWWRVQNVSNTQDIARAVGAFWETADRAKTACAGRDA